MEEEIHLEIVQEIIQEQLEDINRTINTSKRDIFEQKRYLWENLYELDIEEIASNRVDISAEHNNYEFYDGQKRLLLKLQDNTYFGRIDFIFDGEENAEVIYIGIGGLKSKNNNAPIIYDWRAPISSLYYDYNLGTANYNAPQGVIYGKITQKRQLRVRKGKLEYAFNADLKVDDEVLQRELSNNGSIMMRNIVATIQKEQNIIVRDQSSNIMLVQGAAGSGKTSIALHRIAFLLYQNRRNLHSSDVLIISPNRIYAEYISNILPELGEQNITEVSFDEIAQHELKGICCYESKYEQMEYIVECKAENDARLNRIRFKNSITYLEEIKMFVNEIKDTLINFTSFSINDFIFEKKNIEKYYEKIEKGDLQERLDKVGDKLADIYELERNVVISLSDRKRIKQSLRAMSVTTDIVSIYELFLKKIGVRYPIIQTDSVVECILKYEDVFPIILMKFMLNGKRTLEYDRIKHVIIDEMQDYSIVQYEILHMLFKCKMTILGDINQVIDENNACVLDSIQKIFGEKVSLVRMLKSYRSTYEITEFCKKICNLTEIQSFERHGRKPSVEACIDYDDMITQIQDKIDCVDLTKIKTMAIICKSLKESTQIYESLDRGHKEKVYLMNREDAHFCEGAIITSSYLVKGLEFDYVIIPSASSIKYQTNRDRQILYVSCTRALHELDILYYGEKSVFLSEQ